MILGEGGADKTSLAKKIENENYELRSDEESTEGIDVIQWKFPLPNGKEFRVNIWDFGGQEIYHQTIKPTIFSSPNFSNKSMKIASFAPLFADDLHKSCS